MLLIPLSGLLLRRVMWSPCLTKRWSLSFMQKETSELPARRDRLDQLDQLDPLDPLDQLDQPDQPVQTRTFKFFPRQATAHGRNPQTPKWCRSFVSEPAEAGAADAQSPAQLVNVLAEAAEAVVRA